MPYKCKGKCDHEKSSNGGRHPFANTFAGGRKMCSVCMKYIKTEVLRCYCCKTKLRAKPTRSKSRAKRLESVVRY